MQGCASFVVEVAQRFSLDNQVRKHSSISMYCVLRKGFSILVELLKRLIVPEKSVCLSLEELEFEGSGNAIL